MRFDEIVIGKVQRNRRFEIVQFLAECERQPSEALAVRPHGQIRSLDV